MRLPSQDFISMGSMSRRAGMVRSLALAVPIAEQPEQAGIADFNWVVQPDEGHGMAS